MSWRQPLRVLKMALATTALYVFVPWLWNGAVDSAQRASDALMSWRDSWPPHELPLRPGDPERYPRHGFGLVIEWSDGFRINTAAGKVTKHLIGLQDTTIDLRLTDAQLDSVYDAVIRMRLFDYPEPHPPMRPGVMIAPSFAVQLLVKAGDTSKALTWETGELPGSPVPDEWKRLWALEKLLSRMVCADSAYRALPPDRSEYL